MTIVYIYVYSLYFHNLFDFYWYFIIFIAIITGVFAYFIAADTTPNADRQIVEIQAKKPGYKQQFLKLKKEKDIPATGFFKRLMYGAEDKFIYIPINSYQLTNDSVIIQKFIDEGVGLPE